MNKSGLSIDHCGTPHLSILCVILLRGNTIIIFNFLSGLRDKSETIRVEYFIILKYVCLYNNLGDQLYKKS